MDRISISIVGMVLAFSAHAAVVGDEVDYSAEGITLKGYIAYDDSVEGERPGVLVVHEWWGHNDYARERARKLAALGYTALAVDMYGGGKNADHPSDAGKFAGEVMRNIDTAQARFDAAYTLLKNHETVDGERVAAIGYCFGGGVVLHMARFGMPLKGVVSFHGSLGTQTPAKAGEVKAAILVCHGADDGFVTDKQIEDFREEMDAAGVDYEFVVYPNAKHSFTNPGADANAAKFGLDALGYNADADEKSWNDMQFFFDDIFAK